MAPMGLTLSLTTEVSDAYDSATDLYVAVVSCSAGSWCPAFLFTVHLNGFNQSKTTALVIVHLSFRLLAQDKQQESFENVCKAKCAALRCDGDDQFVSDKHIIGHSLKSRKQTPTLLQGQSLLCVFVRQYLRYSTATCMRLLLYIYIYTYIYTYAYIRIFIYK